MCEQRGRHSEAKSLGGFEVDSQFKFGTLKDGNVARFRTFQNLADYGGGAVAEFRLVDPIGREPAGFDKQGK